eukprot:Nitzschia sp. Nitz4//scaffold255_size41878//18177//19328//NITZ4_007403-RA/size41878-processed-gene-0.13-mRNA-1//1//CDS//3329544365//7548//frame0
MSGNVTDPADEAGGEVVYSSDGLAPASIAKPPAVPGSAAASTEDDVLDSEALSPQLAFEIFQGKLYSSKSGSGGAAKKGAAASLLMNPETPLERLARLQQEVDELQAQWTSTTANSGRDFDEQLLALASTLKSQLQSMQANNHATEQDALTRLIRQQLDSLKQGEAASATDAAGTASADTPTGLVYELYGTSAVPTSSLQERLLTLESFVGSSQQPPPASQPASSSSKSSASSSAKTLWHRLEALESLVQSVDATTMEQTTTRAKVIRADLEAASKARNKLISAYKKEDSQCIQQLHQQMLELEGLSAYLPALLERLQQLAGLHVQASTFATRLEALETSTNQVEATLGQMETSVDQLTQNFATNLATLEANLQSLDQRLGQL